MLPSFAKFIVGIIEIRLNVVIAAAVAGTSAPSLEVEGPLFEN